MEESEKEGFLKLLEVPFFNKDRNVISLFQYFSATLAPKKEDWYRINYPRSEYEDIKVRRTLSLLNKLMEQFLSIQHFSKKENLQKEMLLAALRERRLQKHYNNHMKKDVKLRKDSLDFSSEMFLHEYQLSCEKEKFDSQMNQRRPKENTEEGILQLDLFYIVEKLRSICELHNSRTIFEMEGQTYLNDEVLFLVRKRPFKDYPQVRIYTFLLDTITKQDENSFRELQSLVEEFSHLLSNYEEREIYLALVNYCIRKINQGNQQSLEECFLLYQKMAERNLLASGQYLSPWTFKNIITAALRLEELDWTRSFIREYKDKLAPEHRENAQLYNLAKYNFQLRKYPKVIELLQQVEYDDIFYGLDARTLLIKVYYVQEEFEALFSLTDSFRIYLRRKKRIPSERRKTYLNFIKFIRKLVSLSPRDSKGLGTLHTRIQSTIKVADKAWMLEKLRKKQNNSKTIN